MRMPFSFYKEVDEIINKYGDVEYSRDDPLPAVISAYKKHARGDAGEALIREACEAILDRIDKRDEEGDGLFKYDQRVKLGDKRRIKRSAMNLDQHFRRKRVIDANKTAQDRSWAAETMWLNDGVDALKDRSAATKREDVLDEDGTVKGKPKKKRA